jgi:hypothetical protein
VSHLGKRVFNTWLARRLNDHGRIELAVLKRLLWEARAAGAPTLAQSLVKEGLLSAEEVEQHLSEIASVETLSPREPGPTPSEGWSAGGRIDGYVLEEQLGAGGMGVVWQVRHEGTGARRALKSLGQVDSLEEESELLLVESPRLRLLRGALCAVTLLDRLREVREPLLECA